MSYTAAFEAYAAERARALAAAEAGVVHGLGHVLPQQSQQSQPQWPRKRLADDPERLVRIVTLPTGTLTCVGRGCTRALQLDKSRRVDDRAGGRCSAAQRLDAGQRAASAAMRGVVVVIVFISMLPSLSVVACYRIKRNARKFCGFNPQAYEYIKGPGRDRSSIFKACYRQRCIRPRRLATKNITQPLEPTAKTQSARTQSPPGSHVPPF